MVRHPAALAVQEFAVGNDPPYLALEWLEDKSLTLFQREAGPLPPKTVLFLAKDIAGALAAAHLMGLPHGRLNPNAIRITANQRPKIDFTGTDVSAMIESPQPLDQSFHAPELAGQDAVAQPDSAADVYGLGAVLFGCSQEVRRRRGAGRARLWATSV